MNFLPEAIDNYAEVHTSQESELLFELNRQTNIKILQPRMLSGHLQGRLLSMLSSMIKPNTILEIGTYTGYSALCLAEGLSSQGKLVTIEIDPEIAEFAQEFFDRSKYKNQLELKVGDAVELIRAMDQQFDLVFIDADKENYINYLDLVYPKMPIGAYVIADNVLWSGKVTEPAHDRDVDTQILKKFNDLLTKDSRFENVLLPVRDGLMIARKIG